MKSVMRVCFKVQVFKNTGLSSKDIDIYQWTINLWALKFAFYWQQEKFICILTLKPLKYILLTSNLVDILVFKRLYCLFFFLTLWTWRSDLTLHMSQFFSHRPACTSVQIIHHNYYFIIFLLYFNWILNIDIHHSVKKPYRENSWIFDFCTYSPDIAMLVPKQKLPNWLNRLDIGVKKLIFLKYSPQGPPGIGGPELQQSQHSSV
jgi:hypothetical protein